ncbi:hypothetical protein TNCV_1286711 [Trichonephila clavipes]|nr:hypothetical protein TNCV_1286711 [Trichonephila clavipes]
MPKEFQTLHRILSIKCRKKEKEKSKIRRNRKKRRNQNANRVSNGLLRKVFIEEQEDRMAKLRFTPEKSKSKDSFPDVSKGGGVPRGAADDSPIIQQTTRERSKEGNRNRPLCPALLEG